MNMKKNMYICITDSLCCTAETQYCKSTILQLKKRKTNRLFREDNCNFPN